MKKLVAVLAILAACSGVTTASFATAPEAQYLYIQSAKSATIEPIKGSTDSYTLTLKQLHPNVVCFSDRPKRLTNTVSVKKFIDAWIHPVTANKDNFKVDAPNADLNGVKVAGQEPVNIPLELTDPQYNEHEQTLTYKVTTLHGEDKISAMQLHDATLIIDDFNYCTNCPD